MPSLPGNGKAGLRPTGTPVFVLRLGSGIPGPHILEIGFGTSSVSTQSDMKDHLTSDRTLQLTVAFPGSGETRKYSVGLLDEYTADPGDRKASSRRDRSAGQQILAFSLDVLAPFQFSGLAYDPLDSIAASVARLGPAEAGNEGDTADQPPGRRGSPAGCPGSPADAPGQPNDCLMALWAALESDLYRFAKDRSFITALDAAETEQPGEYRRFALLNNLYRDMVKLLVPYGQAPRRWTAWLRGQDYRPVLPASLALGMEKFLAGRSGQPEKTLDSLTRLLAGYGAVVMEPLP
jgi:hypothetical protein